VKQTELVVESGRLECSSRTQKETAVLRIWVFERYVYLKQCKRSAFKAATHTSELYWKLVGNPGHELVAN